MKNQKTVAEQKKEIMETQRQQQEITINIIENFRKLFENPILVTKSFIEKNPNIVKDSINSKNFLSSSYAYPITIKDSDGKETEIIPQKSIAQSLEEHSPFIVDTSIFVHAETQVVAANNVATAILEPFNTLSSFPLPLTDEYHLLLKKIEECEDALINMGKIKEAYKNLSIAYYPTIEVDERSICLLLSFGNSILEQLLVLIQSTKLHPLRALYLFLLGNLKSWHMCVRENAAFISLYSFTDYHQTKKYDVQFPWRIYDSGDFDLYMYFEDGLEDFWTIDLLKNLPSLDATLPGYYLKIGRIKIDKYFCYSGILDDIIAGRNVFEIDWFDPEVTFIALLARLYNSISENRIPSIYGNPLYNTLAKCIDSMNQEIQLSNLRSLHTALRNAVREYKISDI